MNEGVCVEERETKTDKSHTRYFYLIKKEQYLEFDPCTCNLVLMTSKGVVRYALKPVWFRVLLISFLASSFEYILLRWRNKGSHCQKNGTKQTTYHQLILPTRVPQQNYSHYNLNWVSIFASHALLNLLELHKKLPEK